MATHSSILAGKISWTEEPGGLVRRVKESDTTDATEQACLHVPLVSPPSHHPTKSRKNQKPNRAICHLDAEGLHGWNLPQCPAKAPLR